MYEFSFQTVIEYFPYILGGVPMTLRISLTAFGIGLLIGLVIGVIRSMRIPVIDSLFSAYIEVFRNTPVIVQIVWFYYVTPIVFGINVTAVTAGIIALGLNSSAFLAEVFRGGIMGIPNGQMEAGRSLGFSRISTLSYIVIPQALRKMIAPILNQFIVLIKDSALVSYIGVLDLMQRSNTVSTTTARPLESYTSVALLYLLLCLVASKITSWIEKRYAVRE